MNITPDEMRELKAGVKELTAIRKEVVTLKTAVRNLKNDVLYLKIGRAKAITKAKREKESRAGQLEMAYFKELGGRDSEPGYFPHDGI